jgi:hypothetical protein
MPAYAIPETVNQAGDSSAVVLVIGAIIFAGIYFGVVVAIHSSIKKTFMMTVRRLAGTR